MRSMLRTLPTLARPLQHAGKMAFPPAQTWNLATPAASRSFAAAAGKKPKTEDGTLEGRYATALFMASSDRLDKVYGDLSVLREMMQESKEFKLMVETPGIDPDSKVGALEQVCKT